MARCENFLVRCGVQWLGNGGAPSWRGIGYRTMSTCASGCRRSMRGPKCLGLSKGRVPLPSRGSVGDGQEIFMGNASGPEGTQCQPSVVRQCRCVPLSSIKSSLTPKGQMSQVHSNHVTSDSGSPEGCSQPSTPPLCGGVLIPAFFCLCFVPDFRWP